MTVVYHMTSYGNFLSFFFFFFFFSRKDGQPVQWENVSQGHKGARL